MEIDKPIRIAFLQRVLPLYRLGFYKALSRLSKSYHFTLFSEKGEDVVKNIETISPELFDLLTKDTNFAWKDTKTICYHRAKILWQKGVLKPILRKEFDVLMMTNRMTHLFYWLVLLCCKLRGVKIVFWSHGLQGNETGFKLWLKRWYLNLADVNLVYANYNKQFMMQKGANKSFIHVIYNSLDATEQEKHYSKIITEDKKELKRAIVNNNYPTVLFVGRLRKEKKVEILIKAIHLLKCKGFFVNLLIVGDGLERDNLKQLVSELDLSCYVNFIGKLYDEPRLVKYFYVADLFVSPGEVGLNCIHSLFYGLPVITHHDFRFQNPEVEAILENITGLFFKRDDVQDLADKMEFWLTNNVKEISSSMARERVKSFYTPEIQAQRVIDGISMLYEV